MLLKIVYKCNVIGYLKWIHLLNGILVSSYNCQWNGKQMVVVGLIDCAMSHIDHDPHLRIPQRRPQEALGCHHLTVVLDS